MQRELPCPNCNGKVLVNNTGRAFASISGFVQRTFNIKIPTSLLNYLKERLPVDKFTILKGKCETCGGKRTVPDPSDDSDKWAEVARRADQNADRIAELEALTGSTAGCGNQFCLIAGNALWEVGIGMNDAPSFRVDKGKSIRMKGLIDPSKIDAQKGGPIPEGGTCNHVQGINSLASPGGLGQIKCANKFQIVAGTQGIELKTCGPITIGGGITKITAPELSIGSQTGRLALEGEVVNINGKSIEVAPTDGHLFVRGTFSNTGNVITQGHNHSESVSFVKGFTTGRNEQSKVGSQMDLAVGPAFWGGAGVKGAELAVRDIIGVALDFASDPKLTQQALSVRFAQHLNDKVTNLAYLLRPVELLPTGICITAGLTGPTVGTIYNFPHVHALPDGMHTHETRIPDIDDTSDSAAEVRAKAAGAAASAPKNVRTSLFTVLQDSLFALIGFPIIPIENELKSGGGRGLFGLA